MIISAAAVRTFLASFLVLFLEIALIRWMPAYIRLLAYFSNFILLASFLGIGVGCLLAPARVRLFAFFPALMAAVVAAVYLLRLEVSVPTAGSIYFSSGTAEQVVVVESTMLLPLLFVIVAALFATLAQRMGREMAVLPPLQGYTVNVAGSLAGVVALPRSSCLRSLAAVRRGWCRSPSMCFFSALRLCACTSWPAGHCGLRITRSRSRRSGRIRSSR